MKKILVMAALAASSLAATAANMASQPWVLMKLDELRAEFGVTKAVSPMAVDAGTNGTVFAFFEPADVAALLATNSTSLVVTNGATFAWVGNGVYTNAQIASAVFATQTNFVFWGVNSTVVDGVDTFPGVGGFGVTGTYITSKEAKTLTGGGK
jgi:hypothetical protein